MRNVWYSAAYMSVLVLFCSPAAWVSACSSDSAGFDDPIYAMLELADAACDNAHRCRDTYPDEEILPFEFMFGSDAESCKARLDADPGEAAEIRSAIEEGRTRYYQDRARSCHQTMYQVSCVDFWADSEGLMECGTMFEGTVPAGGHCVTDVECVSLDCDEGELECGT